MSLILKLLLLHAKSNILKTSQRPTRAHELTHCDKRRNCVVCRAIITMHSASGGQFVIDKQIQFLSSEVVVVFIAFLLLWLFLATPFLWVDRMYVVVVRELLCFEQLILYINLYGREQKPSIFYLLLQEMQSIYLNQV